MNYFNYDGDIVDFVLSLKSNSVPQQEYKRQIDRFLEMKARKCFIPISGCFELTPLCNLDCKMCYIHLSGDSFSQGRLLPIDTWKTLAKDAHEAGMKNATLTGGECLTYPLFDELYLFLEQMRVTIDLFSNGVLLDKKWIDFFLKHRPQSIKISLYGSNDDVYEKVTGHRVFHLVYNNIRIIRDAGLPLYISITPNRFMQDDIGNLIKLVESFDIPYEINARLFPPRSNTGRNVEDFTLDQYVEIYRLRSIYRHRNLIPNNSADLPEVNLVGKNKRGFFCGAGQSTFTIKYNGELCPCVSLDEYSVSAVALGFREAWNLINKYSVNYPVPGECEECAYFTVCIHCQAMHKNAQPGHCDRNICERTRRLAKEGFLTYNGSFEKR